MFGSGYVLLAFLRTEFVTRLHWLTEKQLVDAVAVGQVTPGPVFTTATFIGYLLAGVPGALVSTVAIFFAGILFSVAFTGRLLTQDSPIAFSRLHPRRNRSRLLVSHGSRCMATRPIRDRGLVHVSTRDRKSDSAAPFSSELSVADCGSRVSGLDN